MPLKSPNRARRFLLLRCLGRIIGQGHLQKRATRTQQIDEVVRRRWDLHRTSRRTRSLDQGSRGRVTS